jgi:hypothetical protein
MSEKEESEKSKKAPSRSKKSKKKPKDALPRIGGDWKVQLKAFSDLVHSNSVCKLFTQSSKF